MMWARSKNGRSSLPPPSKVKPLEVTQVVSEPAWEFEVLIALALSCRSTVRVVAELDRRAGRTNYWLSRRSPPPPPSLERHQAGARVRTSCMSSATGPAAAAKSACPCRIVAGCQSIAAAGRVEGSPRA